MKFVHSSIFAAAVSLWGCYGPTTKDGAFRCGTESATCPDGQRCDVARGLCVSNLGTVDMQITGDAIATIPTVPLTCDDRVRAGAFTNPRPLMGANSSADERSLALSPTGDRIYFLSTRGGPVSYFTAAIDPASPDAATSVQAVTLSDVAMSPVGGAFAGDTAFWFAGTKAGSTELHRATIAIATTMTIEETRLPKATCAFTDPFFADGDPMGELYLAFPLAGCAKTQAIATGRAGAQIGTFYGALVTEPGFAAPTLLTGALTLLASSNETTRRIHYAMRPVSDLQFSNPVPIPIAGWSDGAASDRQLVVRADCKVAYLVSTRAGGAGADDLWVVDITP